MNTLQTIYDKLNKTQLSKHEIELSSIDDLKQLNIKYKDLLKGINEKTVLIQQNSTRVNNAKKELKKAIEEETFSKSLLNLNIAKAQEALKIAFTAASSQTSSAKLVLDQSRELGLDVKTIPAYIESFKWSTPLTVATIKLNQLISKINK